MSSSHSNVALPSLAEHIEAVAPALYDQQHDCFLYVACDSGLQDHA